jgi:hypothetical protein
LLLLLIFALFGMNSVALGQHHKAPAAPMNLQTSNITSSFVVLSWSAASRATSYDLELNGAQVSSTTASSYTFAGLSACTSTRLASVAATRGAFRHG